MKKKESVLSLIPLPELLIVTLLVVAAFAVVPLVAWINGHLARPTLFWPSFVVGIPAAIFTWRAIHEETSEESENEV